MGTKFDCNYGEEEFKTVEAGQPTALFLLNSDNVL